MYVFIINYHYINFNRNLSEFNSNNLFYSIYVFSKQFLRKKTLLLLNSHLFTHDKLRSFDYIKIIVFYNNTHVNKEKISNNFEYYTIIRKRQLKDV